MRLSVGLILLLSIAALTNSACSAPVAGALDPFSAPPAPKATIHGRIVDAGTGAPVEGVDVRFNGITAPSTQTDVDGFFDLVADLPLGEPDTVGIDFSKPGWLINSYNEATLDPDSDTSLGPIEAVSPSELGAGGASGVFLDSLTKAPLAGGIILLFPGINGGWYSAPLYSVETSADGSWSLSGIPSGQYTALASDKDGQRGQQFDFTVVNGVVTKTANRFF